jgi:hypothetical protein
MKEKVHRALPFEKQPTLATSAGTIPPPPSFPPPSNPAAAAAGQIYIFMTSARRTRRFRMHAN